jgi:hypothetical protein
MRMEQQQQKQVRRVDHSHRMFLLSCRCHPYLGMYGQPGVRQSNVQSLSWAGDLLILPDVDQEQISQLSCVHDKLAATNQEAAVRYASSVIIEPGIRYRRKYSVRNGCSRKTKCQQEIRSRARRRTTRAESSALTSRSSKRCHARVHWKPRQFG